MKNFYIIWSLIFAPNRFLLSFTIGQSARSPSSDPVKNWAFAIFGFIPCAGCTWHFPARMSHPKRLMESAFQFHYSIIASMLKTQRKCRKKNANWHSIICPDLYASYAQITNTHSMSFIHPATTVQCVLLIQKAATTLTVHSRCCNHQSK